MRQHSSVLWPEYNWPYPYLPLGKPALPSPPPHTCARAVVASHHALSPREAPRRRAGPHSPPASAALAEEGGGGSGGVKQVPVRGKETMAVVGGKRCWLEGKDQGY